MTSNPGFEVSMVTTAPSPRAAETESSDAGRASEAESLAMVPPEGPVVLPRLRALRKARGMTRGDLAKASGIRVAGIQRLEHGGPVRRLEIPQLRAALGVTIAQLVGEERGDGCRDA
jgi:hypothetical protein